MNIKSPSCLRCLCALLLAGLPLMGCTLGPDFLPPKVVPPASLLRKSDAPDARSALQEGVAPDPKWWGLLGDPLLNRLVARVAAENLDVQAATARIRQSRAERGIAAADLFPQIDGSANYTRQKLSNNGVVSLVGGGASSGSSTGGIPNSSVIPPFNTYQYGFDASWEIDLWGRVRRSVEAADATLQASEEDRRATLLSDIAELVSDYVQLRGAQASLQNAQENLNAAQQTAELTLTRAKGGLGNELDVANATAQAESVRSQLPQWEQQETQLMNAIALLLGQPPGALDGELAAARPIPPLPPQVPIGVPSALARRRPDVREAEAQLHAATAEIGVAKADFFPQVTLMGDGSLQSIKFSDLNMWASRNYSYGPSITLPIFEGGRLTSTLHLRNEQQREAALHYRKALLAAFHEVDNALTAYREEQRRHKAIALAVEQNCKALHLASERYRQGLSSFIDVLDAERNVLATEQQAISSAQAESVNMVQLYKALGGGWDTDFPVAPKGGRK